MVPLSGPYPIRTLIVGYGPFIIHQDPQRGLLCTACMLWTISAVCSAIWWFGFHLVNEWSKVDYCQNEIWTVELLNRQPKLCTTRIVKLDVSKQIDQGVPLHRGLISSVQKTSASLWRGIFQPLNCVISTAKKPLGREAHRFSVQRVFLASSPLHHVYFRPHLIRPLCVSRTTLLLATVQMFTSCFQVQTNRFLRHFFYLRVKITDTPRGFS